MRISLIVIDAQALCISHSFGVQLHQVELLKEQNPLEQSCLEIFLSKEILEGGMIRIHSAFVHDKVRSEFFDALKFSHDVAQECNPRRNSLAVALSSNGSSPVWAIRIEPRTMPSLTMKWLFSQFRAKLVSSHRLNLSKWVKALGL
ncbi:hypothetical protein Tco_0349652 [Tanacetum coccineum]